MLNYNMKKKIFEMYHNDQVPKKVIAKHLKISKNTVKSYLRGFDQIIKELSTISDPLEYDRKLIELLEPKKITRNFKPRVLNEEQFNCIIEKLIENEKKFKNKKYKQLMRGEDIYEELVDKHGYTGSAETVRYHIRKIDQKTLETYIKIQNTPSDKAEFDWGNVELVINKVINEFKLAVFTLPYSNYRFGYIYQNEKTASFVDAHGRFFKQIGGITHKVVYDNMRVAVKQFTARGEDNIPTDALVNMSEFYNFEYIFCQEYTPTDKGNVERGVEVVRRKAFAKRNEFTSIEEAQAYLNAVLSKLNNKMDQTKILEDKNGLNEFKAEFSWFKTLQAKVDKYSTICVDTNRYSVPEDYTGKIVTVKITANHIYAYTKDELIAAHPIIHDKNQWKMELMHYEKTFTRKGKGFANSLALAQKPELKLLFETYFKENHKDFIKVLKLINYTSFYKINQVINDLASKNYVINFNTVKLALDSINDPNVESPSSAQNKQNLIEYTSLGGQDEERI